MTILLVFTCASTPLFIAFHEPEPDKIDSFTISNIMIDIFFGIDIIVVFFSAFYNYGAAWVGKEPRVGWNKLIRAHGYSVDLQLDNKGVRFNFGGGVGQVVSRPFQAYLTTGFDAIF